MIRFKKMLKITLGLTLIIGTGIFSFIWWKYRVTNVFHFLFLFSFLFFAIDFLAVKTLRKKYIRKSPQFSFWLFYMVFFGFELFLRYGSGSFNQFDEANGLFWHRPLGYQAKIENLIRKDLNPHLKRYHPNYKSSHTKKEFIESRATNSLGFVEKEYNNVAFDTSFTVLALGDSFTEGVGAGQDSSWFRFMERSLEDTLPNVLFFNAAIAGSDLVFELHKLKNLLYEELHPDWVVLCLNESDITDIMERGLNERFLKNGKLKYRSGLWFKSVYAISHTARLIGRVFGADEYHAYLGSEQKVNEMKKESRELILDYLSTDWVDYIEKKQIKFSLIINPFVNHLSMEQIPFEELEEPLSSKFMVFNLYKSFQNVCGQNCDHLFWPIDGHNNVAGYKLIGEAVAEQLRDTLIHDYNAFILSQTDTIDPTSATDSIPLGNL